MHLLLLLKKARSPAVRKLRAHRRPRLYLLRKAVAARDNAAASVESAKAALTETQSTLLTSKETLETRKMALAQAESLLSIANANLESAQAQYEEVAAALNISVDKVKASHYPSIIDSNYEYTGIGYNNNSSQNANGDTAVQIIAALASQEVNGETVYEKSYTIDE